MSRVPRAPGPASYVIHDIAILSNISHLYAAGPQERSGATRTRWGRWDLVGPGTWWRLLLLLLYQCIYSMYGTQFRCQPMFQPGLPVVALHPGTSAGSRANLKTKKICWCTRPKVVVNWLIKLPPLISFSPEWLDHDWLPKNGRMINL